MSTLSPAAFIVSWLNSVSAITTNVSGRISTILQPDAGFPQIWVGDVSAPITATDGASVSRIETWTVPIYCMAGRRASQMDDLPDNATAWATSALVVAAMSDLDSAHYVGTGYTIANGVVLSRTPNVAAGNFARVLVNARFSVWRTI